MKEVDGMHDYKTEWQKQLVKCIRCGTCRSVCPVFAEEDNENTTARGKVKLIESVVEGKLELTSALQQRISKCLLCMACVSGCPSGVKTDELFLGARRALADKVGLPLAKKMAFTGLQYRRLFDLGLRTGALFQDMIFKDAPDGRGKLPRIPIPTAGLAARRLIPSLATRPLRRELPVLNKVEKPKARVAFFTGCMLNYVYPDAGKAIVNILKTNGIEVVIPEEQCCCGAPAYTSGDYAAGEYLASHNINVLTGDYDAIITGCASCGASLKHLYGIIIEDNQVKEKWRNLSGKVYDIATFLVKHGYKQEFGELKTKITYHDPCHLVRGMGVSKEPRQILNSIPGVDFAEMKEADKCCGAGGTFSLAYYDLSRQINERKLNNAENSGANLLLTGCSACRMHIADGLSQRGSSMRVMHTAEFIDQAYQAARKGV
jgi:glycolate oxidase iron-sulfur subunit